MRSFPKVALLLTLLSTVLFSCDKETLSTTTDEQLVQEVKITPVESPMDSERGVCGSIGVQVDYTGILEYEFDLSFSGWGSVHFFNNKSGSMKVVQDIPVAVQARDINISNKPVAKANPKCPWVSKKGEVKVTVFMVSKSAANGTWSKIPGTTTVTYTLGSTTPQVLKYGTHVYCIDKPIGKWKACSLSQ